MQSSVILLAYTTIQLKQSTSLADDAACSYQFFFFFCVFSYVWGSYLVRFLHIEGFQPEWNISTMIHSWDIPFWSETLDMWPSVCDRFCFLKNIPTMEVVKLPLHGWCTLGVFLLSAFTNLRHEYQYLFNPHAMEYMRAQTRPRFILSSERVLGALPWDSLTSWLGVKH